MTTSPPGPPRLAERLVAWLVTDPHWREIAIGDLAEEFDARTRRHAAWIARLWYWQQALSFAQQRLRNIASPGRAHHGDPLMRTLVTDCRLAVRALARRPLMTAAIVLTLAFTIGANTVAFGVVDRLMLRPFAAMETSHLVTISESVSANQRRGGVQVWRFSEWRGRAATMTSIAAFRPANVNITDGEHAQRLEGQEVSAGFFELLQIVPGLGRAIHADDEVPGHHQRVVIGDTMWRRVFDADPAIVGRPIQFDGQPYEIVGVAPPGFSFPNGSEFWAALPVVSRGTPGGSTVTVMGALDSAASVDDVHAEITALFAQQQTEVPGIDRRRRVNVWAFDTGMTDNGTPLMLGLFQATALFVLLIGCTNIAGLLLARGLERQGEMSVRVALGARRLQLVRQLLVESLVVSLVAVPGALVTAWGLFDLLRRAVPTAVIRYIPGWADVGIDARVVVVSLASAVVAATVFGLLPALASSRVAPNLSIRRSGRAIAGGHGRLRYGLVALQMALALPLLVSSAMTARAGHNMAYGPQGYDPDGVYQLRTELTPSRYPTDASRARFVEQLLESARRTPGVTSVGVTSILPSTLTSADRTVIIDGVPADPDRPQYANYRQVSADYLDTMAIPIVSGRSFTAEDSAGSLRVSIVSASLVQRHFGEASPIGRRIQTGTSDDTWTTIVGVAGDTIDSWTNARGVPTIYVPFAQHPTTSVTLVARTTTDPDRLGDDLRRAVASVDPDQPVFGGAPMRAVVHERTVGLRLIAGMMSTLGVLALGLAAFGAYSLMATTVAQRRREIGVRMALGATARHVLALTMRQGATPVVAGIVVGLAAAIALTRVLARTLFGLLTPDLLLVAGVAVLLAGVALAATIIPARRAARLNPAVVIRE